MINSFTQVKKEDNISEGVESEPPEKKFRLNVDESPPTSEDEDDNCQQNHKNINTNNNSNHSISNYIKDNETEDTDGSSNSSQTEEHQMPFGFQPRPYSQIGNSSASAHVRSCARFPLLTQGLKQMANPSNGFSSFPNKTPPFAVDNSNKSEVKGLAALINHKKKSETSRDRLFKSLKGLTLMSGFPILQKYLYFKGLKKSSELSARFGANPTSLKKNKSNGCSTATSTSSVMTQSSSCSSNSCSSTSSSSNQNSRTLSPFPSISSSTTTQISDKTENNSKEIKCEINDETTDEEVTVETQSGQRICDNMCTNGGLINQIEDQIQTKKEIIKPKYVVSPHLLTISLSYISFFLYFI